MEENDKIIVELTTTTDSNKSKDEKTVLDDAIEKMQGQYDKRLLDSINISSEDKDCKQDCKYLFKCDALHIIPHLRSNIYLCGRATICPTFLSMLDYNDNNMNTLVRSLVRHFSKYDHTFLIYFCKNTRICWKYHYFTYHSDRSFNVCKQPDCNVPYFIENFYGSKTKATEHCRSHSNNNSHYGKRQNELKDINAAANKEYQILKNKHTSDNIDAFLHN
ncbi:MAG: hypothetical protein ACYCPT_08355 [Acidimicrobiales bacterium]